MVRFTPVPNHPTLHNDEWRRLDPSRKIKLKPWVFWRNKPAGIVILLLSVLLFLSPSMGMVEPRRRQNKTQLDTILTEIMHNYEEGVALVDLNPIRARTLLKKTRELVESGMAKFPSGKEEQELAAMLKKIDASLAVAARRYEVVLESYFELSLIKPQGAGDEMALYQDALVVLDRKNRLVYRLLLSSKSARILSGDQKLADAKSIAVHGENVFVLADDVGQVTMPSGQLVQVMPVDTEWGKIAEVASYAGNIYLLDAQKNQIWKYIRTETGFSLRQDYLLLDTLIDLSYAKNLAIDGYVWLIKGHEIIRFVQGQLYPWKLIGLDDDLGISLRLYTDDTTKNIYILDTDNRRVIIADKDGEYLSQYVWTEDIPVSDMVVSEVAKKILLLSGGTIYGIDLK